VVVEEKVEEVQSVNFCDTYSNIYFEPHNNT